jgi:hypothetical protein
MSKCTIDASTSHTVSRFDRVNKVIIKESVHLEKDDINIDMHRADTNRAWKLSKRGSLR